MNRPVGVSALDYAYQLFPTLRKQLGGGAVATRTETFLEPDNIAMV